MKVAVQGCCHGELDILYATLQNQSIDLLIICGDFQCLRSVVDLPSLACPAKYRRLGNFYEYYSGLKEAPFPTLFIGGNHEASSYLWELFHGGFVAHNIYFLGFAGVVKFGGLRIGGVSGIYKENHYNLGYYEKHPLNEDDCRSIYHTRKFNVYRLSQIKEPLDIFLSHDWPRGIAYHGNVDELLLKKPFFSKEENTLGSEPCEMLLKILKPRYWFSAHLHVKFEADYNHSGKVVNPDEILLDEYDQSVEDECNIQPQITHFLALDKILPKREFYKVFEFPTKEGEPLEFQYDKEWLSIIHATIDYMTLQRKQIDLPDQSIIEEKIKNSRQLVESKLSNENMKVPDFIMTAHPFHSQKDDQNEDCKYSKINAKVKTYINPQTVHLCNLLGIKNNINPYGEVVNYGDPARKPKHKYTNWNTPDYVAQTTQNDEENNEDDGFV